LPTEFKTVPENGAAPSSVGRGLGKDAGEIPLRFVTAASLFDGHDAAINIIRRILLAAGAEVIHLGHNRSVDEVVTAAVQEDAHGIAVSSYQGGHMEYFKYMIDLLRERGRDNVKVFGGGGGVIVPSEISELQEYGVTRIYAPADGQNLGLRGMIDDMMEQARATLHLDPPDTLKGLTSGSDAGLARIITAFETGTLGDKMSAKVRALARRAGPIPVLGITGTGGAGKSSLTDELIRRFRFHSGEPRIAVLAIDPSRRKTGGALLGDRIRMNAISSPGIFVRSLGSERLLFHLMFFLLCSAPFHQNRFRP